MPTANDQVEVGMMSFRLFCHGEEPGVPLVA
jgi:hypothetical protein